MPNTPNYSWTTPTVGGNADTWGTVINAAFDAVDAKVYSIDTRAASTSLAGQVRLATDAEAQAGTATDRAVTPAALAARTATDARTGVVELATAAETKAGTSASLAVTPAGLTGNQSLGTNGYIVRPGGFTEQWGYYAGGSDNPTINFSTPFTTIYGVQITPVGTGSSTQTASQSVPVVSIQSLGTSSFSAFVSHENEASDVFLSATNKAFYWKAYGVS